MSSTFTCLNVHFVFGTKHLAPSIEELWRKDLHAYLGGCLRESRCHPHVINGVADHAHALAGLRSVDSLAIIMRDIKAASSRWVHETIAEKSFGWQDGYGAFSVSQSQMDIVIRYIERQEEHHRQKSFRDEYREFMVRHEIPFEEKYLL